MKTERGVLSVVTPQTRVSDRQYILRIVLTEFLGLPFVLSFHEAEHTSISCLGYPGRIDLPDVLFRVSDRQWKTAASLPREPLRHTFVGTEGLPITRGFGRLPVLYGSEDCEKGIRKEADALWLPVDIPGSCFAVLTRYEEVVASPTVLDEHYRFPASASLLSRQDLLERPIVDEYVSLLAAGIEHLWPGLLKERAYSYEPVLTHDVDHPLSTYGQAASLLIRRAVGDIVFRRDPFAMLRRLKAYFGSPSADPNNTFAWLMDQSERRGLKSRFHFMAASKTRYDSGYDIGAPAIRDIIRNISERGHEIGIHPSYRTSDECSLLKIELGRLEEALTSADVTDWSRTSRQHYLRWNAEGTWRELESVGLVEDSSVGFADAPGFRCGTARAFTTYDWTSGKPLQLKELPLIVMDVTLSGKRYLGLGWDEAITKVTRLADQCRTHHTPFTLLWHNDKVLTSDEKDRYTELLNAIA